MDIIEEGVYKGRAVSWDLGKTRKQTPFVAVEFDLLDAPSGDGVAPKRTWYGWLSDKALPYTVRSLRACGWKGNDLSALDGLDSNEVFCELVHEVYNGKTREKINGVTSLDESPVLSNEERRKLADKMASKIAAVGAGKPASDGPPPLTDDDIPF